MKALGVLSLNMQMFFPKNFFGFENFEKLLKIVKNCSIWP